MMNPYKIIFVVVFGCFFQMGFSQVGINTTTPLSTLDICGNLNVKEIGVINANVVGSAVLYGSTAPSRTVINDGVYISISPSGSNNDFELPNAVNVPGRIYIIRNISDTNWAFIYTAGGDFYARNSKNITTQPLNMKNDADNSKSLIFISDGKNWTYFN